MVLEQAGLDYELNVWWKRKRTVKNDTKVFVVSKWKNRISIFRNESEYRKSKFTVEGPMGM